MDGELRPSTGGKSPILYKKRRTSTTPKKPGAKKATPKKDTPKKAKGRTRKDETPESGFRAGHAVLGTEGLSTSGGKTTRAAAKTSSDRISDSFAVQPPVDTFPDSLDDQYSVSSVQDTPTVVPLSSLNQQPQDGNLVPEVAVRVLAPGKIRVNIFDDDGSHSFILNKSDLVQQAVSIAQYVEEEEATTMNEVTEISLEEITADSFTVFQAWLETSDIKIPPKYKRVRFSGCLNGHSAAEVAFLKEVDPILDLLVDCWLLGSQMQSLAFMNSVMSELLDGYKGAYEYSLPLSLGNLKKICDNTVTGSQLRKVLTDVLHFCLDGPTLTAAAEQNLIPLEIMTAIAADAVDNELNGVLRKAPWDVKPKVYFVWEGGQIPPSPELDF